MAVYTNTQRLTGLSGIDTESMITQLMKAEGLKLSKLQKTNTSLTWKQEAYWTVAEKLKGFQDKFLSSTSSTSLWMKGTISKYSSTVKMSNGNTSSAVKANAGSSATAGIYKLMIDKLATKDTYTVKTGDVGSSASGAIDSKSAVNAEDLASLMESGGSFNLTLDGSTKLIKFEESEIDRKLADLRGTAADPDSITKESAFTALLQDKIDSNFGKNSSGTSKITVANNGGKFSIKPTGNGHTLTISEGTAITQTTNTTASDINGINWEAFKNTKQMLTVTTGSTSKNVEIDFTGFTDEDFASDDISGKILSHINSTLSANGVYASFSEGENGITLSTSVLSRNEITITGFTPVPEEDATEASEETTEAEDGDEENTVTPPTTMNLFDTLKIADDSATLKKTSTLAIMNIVSGDSNHLGSDDKLGDILKDKGINFVTNEETGASTYTMKINTASIVLDANDTVDDMMKKINNSGAGVTMSYDKLSQTYSLQSNKEGAMNAISFGENSSELLGAFGFSQTSAQKATDAEFSINGTKTTRDSNTFSYEGITFTLNSTTTKPEVEGVVKTQEEIDNETITITVEKDTEYTKSLFKDFVASYNELIGAINGLVNEKRAKSYGSYFEPLTDDEKKAMSESEVAKWDTEAKKGLLNRDSILSGITSDLRTQLYQSVTLSDGSKLSLFQIGIETSSDYTTQGQLVLDEDKLNEAFEKYGDKVMELFHKNADSTLTGKAKHDSSGLSYRMNTIINNAIGSNGSISKKAGAQTGYTRFNNELYNQLNEQSTKITNMMNYLAERENYYYTMFSKLEAAISKSDSQMSYVTQVFGQ